MRTVLTGDAVHIVTSVGMAQCDSEMSRKSEVRLLNCLAFTYVVSLTLFLWSNSRQMFVPKLINAVCVWAG